jgi:hypothetical protein
LLEKGGAPSPDWRIHEVRFGDGPLTKEHPDGQDTRIRAARERLKALMDGRGEEGDLRSALVPLAARLIVEEGLEVKPRTRWDGSITRVARLLAPARNGYRTGRLKTAEGMVEYAAPQISDRVVPFRSRLGSRDYPIFSDHRGWPLQSAVLMSWMTPSFVEKLEDPAVGMGACSAAVRQGDARTRALPGKIDAAAQFGVRARQEALAGAPLDRVAVTPKSARVISPRKKSNA